MSDKPITVLARIEGLERALKGLSEDLDLLTKSTRESFGGIMQTLQGIILASGADFDDKVEAAMVTKQKERIDAKASQEKLQVEALVSQGILVPIDTVDTKSLLVGRLLDKDGVLLSPRLQTEYSNLTPAAKEQLLGKAVGFLWESSPGNSFELLEIYKIELEKPEPEMAE